MINSAIGAYYYLRIIVVMYMRESRKQVPVTPIPVWIGHWRSRSAWWLHSVSRHASESGSAIRPAVGAGIAAAIAVAPIVGESAAPIAASNGVYSAALIFLWKIAKHTLTRTLGDVHHVCT